MPVWVQRVMYNLALLSTFLRLSYALEDYYDYDYAFWKNVANRRNEPAAQFRDIYYDFGAVRDYGLRQNKATTKAENYLEFSFFPALDNFQSGAQFVTEDKYQWIAQVVHSPTNNIPHMCTAVCIDTRIFITASRCIHSLKLNMTSVFYKKFRFTVRTFILPSDSTKQEFDDIGFIVVNPSRFTVNNKWTTIQLIGGKRTDSNFAWFTTLNLHNTPHKVVGYAAAKWDHKVKSPALKFNLTDLDVIVDIKACPSILAQPKAGVKGFNVPCYLGCTVAQFKDKTERNKCNTYHGVEGGALINVKTNRLTGIATWGAMPLSPVAPYELPVGFSVPNSDNFLKDFACAKKIRGDNKNGVQSGYYQKLCDK